MSCFPNIFPTFRAVSILSARGDHKKPHQYPYLFLSRNEYSLIDRSIATKKYLYKDRDMMTKL
eukprot:COSAG06_NODE_27018_length_603_cov_0.563492_1_plen_62_part_10